MCLSHQETAAKFDFKNNERLCRPIRSDCVPDTQLVNYHRLAGLVLAHLSSSGQISVFSCHVPNFDFLIFSYTTWSEILIHNKVLFLFLFLYNYLMYIILLHVNNYDRQ